AISARWRLSIAARRKLRSNCRPVCARSDHIALHLPQRALHNTCSSFLMSPRAGRFMLLCELELFPSRPIHLLNILKRGCHDLFWTRACFLTLPAVLSLIFASEASAQIPVPPSGDVTRGNWKATYTTQDIRGSHFIWKGDPAEIRDDR